MAATKFLDVRKYARLGWFGLVYVKYSIPIARWDLLLRGYPKVEKEKPMQER